MVDNSEKPLYKLWEVLGKNNYEVPDNYDDFEYTLTLPGKEGSINRQEFYKSLYNSKFDVPDNYDDFANTLFVPANNQSAPTKDAQGATGVVTNATPTPTPVIEPQQPTDVKQKIQPAELTEKEVGDDLAFMREANKSRGDILEAAPQAQRNNGYSTPKMDKAWKLGYSQSWGKIKGLFDGLDYGKKDVTVDLDDAVKSRYDSMSDQAIESELQKLSKEYKAGQWEGGEEALRARISRLQFNLVAHEYGFKDFKDLLSRRGEAEFEMYKYHPAFEQEWLATYKGGPGENPLLNWGKEIVKKQLIEDTMNGVNRPAGYYHSLPFSNEEFSKRYASWALKRAKALGNMGFADVYNNGIKTWESYIGAGLLESGAEEAMAQGAGYRDVGVAGGKYNSDFDAAAATAWNMAEDEYRRLANAHSDEIWGNYASMGGGREGRIMASSEWAVSNMADDLTSHDLDKMIDNAWKSLGESKQKQIVLAAAQNLKQQYPGMSPAEMVKTAQSMVRQQTIQRVLDYAKQQNAPKNVVDYFARKVLAQNSIIKIQEAMARSRAGTTGDWQAREMAMQEYGKNHRVAGIAGTVVGMGLDPVTYISAGVGKGAATGAVKLIEKGFDAAGRKWLTTTAGKIVTGAVGGAGNLGAFEGINEALEQLRWGGAQAVDLNTGLIKTTGYDAGKVGKAIFHGTTMGAGTGIVAPLVGNVWSPFMEATSSTAGKMAVKTGELFTGTIAEGTIFSIPDVYNAYTESENIIKSISDKKSRNYISDEQERAKAIAKVREQRNETMLDAWSESVATMAGFKMKHVGQRLYELSQSGNGRAGFETRLRYMLDRKPDLALTKDEQAELERGGYADLKELVDAYVEAEKNRRANSKPVVTGKPRPLELGTREEDMPYNRFVDLMNDGSISEAARAKMYYYITGHALPMSTVMYGQLTENKDRDGNVKGYTVQSIGANGVVTSREFTSRKRAENELQKVNRQIELNTIDIGERNNESIGNSTKELREDIGQKYGVDVEKALKKEPKRRSTGEQMALDEYMRRLFPEKEAREEDAEDVTFSDDADVPNETTNGFTDEPTDEGDAIVVETLSRTGEDGMLHPAVLKGDDEAAVHIVGGTVATFADGTIDVANSDQDIVVVTANNERKMVNINDIASVGALVDPNAAMDAAEQMNTEPGAAGTPTPQPQPTTPTQESSTGIAVGGRYNVVDEQNIQHEVEVLRDNGNGTLEVRVDGAEDSMPMAKDQLAAMLGIDVASTTPQTEQPAATTKPQQEPVEQPAPAAENDMQPAAVDVYRIADDVDDAAITDAGFSRENIQATADYLNGKIDERAYLERLGFDKDVLAGIDDDKVNAWVEGVANRASAFLTDKPVESGDVKVESDEVPADAGTTLTPTPQPEAADATEVEATTEPMPMLDDGNPDYSQVDANRAHDYLYSDESGLDKSEADEYVQAQIDAAEKALSKIDKRPLKMGTDLAKYRAEKQRRQEQLDAAKANVEYWEKVKAVEHERQAQAAAERKAADAEVIAQAQAEEEARQAAEVAKQQEQAERGAGAVHSAIAEKWNNAPKIEGYKDEVVLANGERVPGTYYLVESGAVTPSHNASREFEKYEGFPVDENGNTINDRDYERDKDAQNITRSIADKYDSRALQTPVIVSKDGVVLSGNGRTMAGELAASNNTDGAYIEHLKNYGRKYGFSPEQVSSMQHPRAVFVPDADMPYTTDTFAKFNAQEMKGQSKTEQAVKLGKVVDDATFNQVVRAINEHETLGDFYGDTKAATEAINALRRAGAINDMQYAEMFDGDAVSDRGRQIIENMLIGKAFEGNPDVIRMLTEYKGFRQSVVTALNEISTNVALGKDYSLENELAQAIELAYKARKAGFKENEPVSPYATQLNLFPFEDGETVADYNNAAVLLLADRLNDKRPTLLKKKLQDYNQQSAENAAGQMDIFSGSVKDKKEIIKTVLNTLHNGEREETQRPEQRGPVADERGGEASLQEDGAAGQPEQGESNIQGLESYSEDELRGIVEEHVRSAIADADMDAEITGIRFIGSRTTGTARADSDLDVLVEYQGTAREDSLFNVLNDEDNRLVIDGITVDINPITPGKSGTIEEFMRRNAGYKKETTVQAQIALAEQQTETSPSEAQKEAGNYKKGHVKIDGFDVSIEQPKGSVRSGVDDSGKPWSQTMNNTYGYIRGTEGVDGDHIDVFFSDNLDGWNGTVYVVDQVEKGGIFDEHKVMYGFNSEEDARKAYLSNYEDGWDGLGAITAVSKDEFKKWIDSSHRKTKPFAEYKNVKVEGTQEQEPKQQGTLFPATEQQPSSKSETKPRTTEKQPAEAPKERIDDVGEKIEGAKKDLAKKMGERINLDADTFPKMFPKYDLKKLISQGLDPNLAVMTKMLRQMAQADYKHYSKKRMYGKSYALRAARFYAAYAKQVLEAGDSNVDFKSEGLGFTDYGKQFVELNKRLFEKLYNKLGDDLFDLDLAGAKIQPLSQKEGSTWFRRNQETGEMEPYSPAYAFVGPRGQNYYEANELDKALQEGVEQVTKSIDYKKAHPYKLGHYYKPGIKNSDYVGVKLGGKIVPLTEPMTSSEVRKYMSEHNAELQAKAAQLDEQRKLDKKKGGTGEGRWKPELTLGGGRPRVGVDRRGGVDVEPEEFRKAFSFRGVQFGNYVTQRERQRFLNEAYDALMDMAELLGISPRAIAIDGRLGFAIGARGGGKANAHYEPKENVINLTKSKGAGSLAHEWFHALDYYFNRGDKKPTASTANKSIEQFPASTRNEMRKAFLDLMSAIKNSDYFKRSENLEMKLRSGKLDEGYYDKPTELAARAFQDYVVRKLADQGKINDFLSSFTSEEEWNGEPENYPFPIGAEAEKIDEKFDALFDAMQERTDEEGNTILYHLGKDHDVLTDTEIALRDGLVDVMRSVGIDVETDEVKGQKVLDNAIQANATLQEMRGWHGSAAEFDEFDHSHMSEGEGNQAIGYGTYIASIEEIGRYYGTVAAMQKRFRAAPGYGDYDHYWKGQKIDLSSINPLRMAYDIVQREGTIKKAIAMVEKFVDNPEAHEGWRSALDILRESRKSDFKRKRANYEGERYLYEVDIPENDGTNYLPWDEPLSDAMRERIAQGLRDMGVDLNEPFERRTGKADNFDFLDEQMSEHPITGQELYYKLVDRFGRYPQQASEFLNKYCGLVGIEYPSNFFSGGNKKGLKNHVVFNEKDIKIDNRTQYFISADGVVYGFVKDGKIYIDPKIASAETPIHEYCHLWGDALKEANPEAWERLKETMLGEKDVLDYVKKMYPGLEGDALVSEVFSHYSGRRGAERLRADMEREMKNAEGVFAKARVARVFDIIRRALSRFWEMARDLFAGKNANLKDLTAEDFADMAMNDLLRGFKPRKKVSGETFYSNAERAVENIKQNKATAEQWKAMLTKAGGIKAGEDKWMGLSTWLDENKGKSLTKDEVLQFVRDRLLSGAHAPQYTDSADVRFSTSPADQVYSDNFKNWFGDWENDSENASKVVDEDGRPLVVDGCYVVSDNDFVKKYDKLIDKAKRYVERIREAESKTGATYPNVDFFYTTEGARINEDLFRENESINQLVDGIIRGNEPKIRISFRYGKVRENGKSWNYRDNRYEDGVSTVGRVADLNTKRSSYYETYFGDEPYYIIAGIDVGNKGADGETLLSAPVVLGKAEDAGSIVKSATDNNGEFSRENPDIRFSVVEPNYVVDGEVNLNARNYEHELAKMRAHPLLRYLWNHETKIDLPYRDVFKTPTTADYFVQTETTFEPVPLNGKTRGEVWDELKGKYGETYHRSDSGSEYLIDEETGDIYRRSDHWGRVASCRWYLDLDKIGVKNVQTSRFGQVIHFDAIGKSNIKDFKGIHGSAFTLNPEVEKRYIPLAEQTIANYRGILGDNRIKKSPAVRKMLEDTIERTEKLIEGARNGNYGISKRDGVMFQKAAPNDNFEDVPGVNKEHGEADDSGISDEELAGYDAGRYSFAESITQGLVDLALKNTHDQQLRLNAMREFGGNLAKLRKIMNKQKAYDKGTVDDIVRLARMVMGSGFFKDMSAYEVKRLLAAIKKGVGAEDLTPIANNVVDMLVQHQLRESKNMLHKLMQVRGRKVDARGVEVQAGLDIDGQRMMSALKDGMSLGENGLSTRINDCENRLDSQDEIVKKNAVSEYQGLMLAKDYHDNILSGEEEEILLREEKRQEEEKIYDFRRDPVLDDDGNAIMNLDGSVRTVERKTLKPEFKTNVTEENKRKRKDVEAAIEKIEQSIRENRMERVTAYSDFISDVVGDVRASRERAAAWRDEQLKRVEEIHHNANSDLEGVPVQSQVKLPEGGLLAFNSNNDIVRLLFQPLATFEKMLRFFGRKAHNGEGYLFNRFMRGWADCSDKEWRSKRAAHEELDAKVRELFGKKVKRWSDLYEIERNKKHPGIPVEYWDNGERVRETMSQGEALSLVVWSKQKDAEAGLRRMGISEEDIETIKNNLDPKFLQLAEWVVEEFLPKRREYYNEVHERMFGAPMAAIEHYFPIVRNSRDVEKPSDITERDLGETKPSTITGNIIKRQRTAATLDVHTDFFDHLLKHLDDMENWAAWAEFNRDINTLRNYKRFKNRVLNMHSVEYGSGKDLWKAFDDACAIAAGVYHPSTKRGSGDNLAVNIAKGVTGAKIAFRFYTAAKQLLSLPAFWNGDAGLKELAKWENPVGAIIAWNWAMKNLPGFSKRWQSRQVGDVRLMDTDSDYAFWRNNMVRALRRGGMWANALVDGMTVAMGARAVYETKKKRYLRNGYSEEQAEKRAMQDAAINYNSSQQSSENAFLSSLQLDRTWWSTLMTVFRSASMGYQRRLTTGLRNLKNRMKKGYKAESIEFMKKQMMRDGIDEATAEKAARRTYRWGGLKSMADVFVFGFVLPFFWNLGPYALYLLMGDDDDEKKDMLKDASVHSLFGPVEGLTGGNAMSEIGNTYAGYLMSDNDKSLLNALRYHDYLSMPLGSDLQQIFNEAGNDSMAAWTDAFNLLVQAGIGINPETFTDTWVAIADACDGDPQTTKEFALCFMRVMQVPQTQTDKLFIDELGMTAKDAQKLNAMEMADRYAKYKRRKNDPLSYITHSEDEQNIYEKYRNRFLDNMQERMEKMDDEQLEWNFENPNDSERRKAVGKAYAKGKGVEDTAGKKPASNWKPETRRSQLKYQRLRDWTDLAEDVLLDTAIDQAKNRGDDERLKALQDAKKELTEIKRGKHTETWDVNGLGDGSAEDDKAIMDELRARRKELLRELGVI